MYLLKESLSRLNEEAISLVGSTASFKVHYWGIYPKLMDNPLHKHSFFEVCYVMDGIGEYTDNGVFYPLAKGTHFCSRPGITHQIRTQEGLFLLYIAFEIDESKSQPSMTENFRELALSQEIWIQEDEECPTALLWKSLLLQEQDIGTLPSAAIPVVAYALLQSFLTLFGKNEKKPAATRHGPNLILSQAKLYILDNLAQPLSLGSIANYLNVSERHLSRLFGEGIHESFTTFIRNERIRKATDLLAHSELTIKEIAEASGFASVHYFTRLFTKEKQLPPGKYRKNKR
ncbi:helix-turn-helix domain-containing protein [Cohnella sp.]|uniref:helix-turn-helix domain-containing protein n=1 Tax=Cohnella sp. TaxID=1883426 RepID=UPI003565E55A